jgi:hypothetical protein
MVARRLGTLALVPPGKSAAERCYIDVNFILAEKKRDTASWRRPLLLSASRPTKSRDSGSIERDLEPAARR